MVKSTLNKKFFRGIKNNFSQLISIVLMLILGVTIFIGIDSTWRSLEAYKDNAYSSENKSDIEVFVTPTLSKEIESKKVQDLENISSVELSFQSEAIVENFSSQGVILNAVKEDFTLNRYTVTDGQGEIGNDRCVVDKSFAEENKIKIGDKLSFSVNDISKEFIVNGLVTSSSYMYITPDSTTVVPDHKEYGFVYLSLEDAKTFTNNTPIVNRILIEVNEEKNIEKAKKSVEKVFQNSLISLLSTKETLNDLAINQKSTQYKTIDSLFPVIFFAIVILMSFTTMYRLINKERTTIGIMKSLGLSNARILFHYLSYSLLVSLTGTIVGVLLGWKLIPSYIWKFFEELFIFNDYSIVLDVKQVILISITSIMSTCLATIFVFKKLGKEEPATLLREKAVSVGKKNIIEKVPLIWGKLRTSQKLIIRQIFNGKVRAVMTILGVIGCTALLLSALGIRDTINSVATSVYEKSYLYESKIYLDESKVTPEFIVEENKKKKNEFVEERGLFFMSDKRNKSGMLHVLENDSELIKIHNLKGEPIDLKTGDILITEKTAEIYRLKKGDTLRFNDTKGESIKLEINKIGILNIGQGVYLTQATWKNLKQNFSSTSIISSDKNVNYLESYSKKISKTEKQKEDFLSSMSSTLSMSMLLILAASLLLIVVLYNLGILNFGDRSRSLATLSVLGFKPFELKTFLSTENIILSIMGIVLGIPIGILLHKKIFVNAGMGDELDFTPIIEWQSY
ncbi:ABC transporter permease [Carnobacterium maltaromaticum]|uniref:ABC transporter permease n=1 Tax=Carnobacterium maltaromaticum TaxID=2751 RepID=UPI002152A9C9|nr:FtsX-like permease family protein [Carnobacterium maltaromaticum]